jgi:hypothetical protein
MGIRTLLGWGSVAIRTFDLAVVTAIIVLLPHWLSQLGRSPVVRIWTAVALFGLYFSTSEWCHCQRDTWMLLPTLVALALRRWQVERYHLPAMGPWVPLAWAALEGACWGAAVWIKPHTVPIALACWATSVLLMRRASAGGRMLALDLGGLLAGGLLSAAPGLAWLAWSGAWNPFWDTQLHWNPEYVATTRRLQATWKAASDLWKDFFPWSLTYLVAVPLAVTCLWRLVRGRAHPAPPRKGSLPVLAAAYLAWGLQVWLVQGLQPYQQVPVLFLGVTLLAGWRWLAQPMGITGLLLFAALACACHPYLSAERRSLWSTCLWHGSNSDVQNRLALLPHRIDWVALERVADYLRTQEVGDGELTCYHAWTSPLYAQLGVRPSTRYTYFDGALVWFPSRRAIIREEMARSGQRFLVSDLALSGLPPQDWASLSPEGPLDGPLNFPPEVQTRFPWSHPAVFRAGRYVVLRPDGCRP